MKALTLGMKLEAHGRRSLRDGSLLAVTDVIVISSSFFLAHTVYWLASGLPLWHAVTAWPPNYGDDRLLLFFGLALACVLSFWRFGHYARRRPFWHELGDVLGVALTMAVLDAALLFLTKSDFSRLTLVGTWSLAALLVPLSRAGLKHALIKAGPWRRPTVIVGLGPNALDASAALTSEPLLGLDVVAFVAPPGDDTRPGAARGVPAWIEVDDQPDPSRRPVEPRKRRLPVLQARLTPYVLPKELGDPHVVVALELDEMARCGDLVEQLSVHYGDVDVVSPMRGLPLVGAQATHYFAHDVLMLRLYNNLARPWPRLIKRGFDLVVAAALLVVTAPLFALIAWAIRREGPGPIFYRHTRIGQAGQPFTCYKFRSMVPNADELLARILESDAKARAEWEADHKLHDDPRITEIGRWLRKTSLDELPQLWNVLRGDMSLVGPRPVVADELARYGKHLIYYTESKPGMTGLWQISGRSDLDYRRRVYFDCWYAKNWTIWYDIIILLKTGKVVLRRQGAR